MAQTKFTPGPWRVGKAYGAVVADSPIPEMRGSEDVEAYGGHLIAESIAPNNLPVIAAAPQMYDALQECEEYFDSRADADHNGERFVGNAEMNLLTLVRAALAKAVR